MSVLQYLKTHLDTISKVVGVTVGLIAIGGFIAKGLPWIVDRVSGDSDNRVAAEYSDWRDAQTDEKSSDETWGPDRTAHREGDRPTIAKLNSVSDDPAHGDQRQFVRIRDLTDGTTWTRLASLQRGHQYEIRALVINNSDDPVRYPTASIFVPSGIKEGEPGRVRVTLSGSMSTDSIYDSAQMQTKSGDFALRYVPGSAAIEVDGDTQPLNVESLFGSGADISTTKVGEAPALPANFSGVVRFSFQADQPQFLVDVDARRPGITDRWFDSTVVARGNDVEINVGYDNTGSVAQDNVVVKVAPDVGMSLIPGSTSLKNAANPNKLALRSNGVTSVGVNIGNYTPGSNAFLYFRMNVTAPECSQLTVTATVYTANGSKQAKLPVKVAGIDCQ